MSCPRRICGLKSEFFRIISAAAFIQSEFLSHFCHKTGSYGLIKRDEYVTIDQQAGNALFIVFEFSLPAFAALYS
jgi:hypothetical protein